MRDFVVELIQQDDLLLIGLFKNDPVVDIESTEDFTKMLRESVFTGVCISDSIQDYQTCINKKFPGISQWN